MIDDVDCEECGMPFLDDENNLKSTHKHKCGNCGKTTRGNLAGVCNPLKSFVFGGNGANVFGDLEIVALDDVVDCVTKNGGQIMIADISNFIADNTPLVEPAADVSMSVARCAKPPKVKKCKKQRVIGDVVKGGDADSAVGPSVVACDSVGQLAATPKRVVDSTNQKSTNSTKNTTNIEQVSYRSFKRGAQNGSYTAMYLTLVNDVEHSKHMNFTHHASYGNLGHGDATTLQHEAATMMGELQSTYKQVFSERTYPVKRSKEM